MRHVWLLMGSIIVLLDVGDRRRMMVDVLYMLRRMRRMRRMSWELRWQVLDVGRNNRSYCCSTARMMRMMI